MQGLQMEESKVIAQLKSGNISALRSLVERYQSQAVRIAVLITRDQAAAEDIVQSAFIRCYEHIGQFDSSRPFRPWFLRIVTNAALKTCTRQKQNISIDESEDDTAFRSLTCCLETASTPPEEVVQRNEIRETILAAFEHLSPRQKAAIVYRYYLDFSEKEIAAQMECAQGTVKWHLSEARERLRSLLQTFDREGD